MQLKDAGGAKARLWSREGCGIHRWKGSECTGSEGPQDQSVCIGLVGGFGVLLAGWSSGAPSWPTCDS